MAFAEWSFNAYGYDKDSKITRLAQWNQVLKSSGIEPEGLKAKPELNEAAYLWSLYCEIKSGCENITYQDILAYQSLVSSVTPYEVETMIKIDNLRVQNGH